LNDRCIRFGVSATKMTRKGAPFHGVIGEGRIAISAASAQAAGDPSPGAASAGHANARNAPAIASETVAAANRGPGDKFEPL